MSRRKSDQENEAAAAATDATLAPSSLSDEQAEQLAQTYAEPGDTAPTPHEDGNFRDGYAAAQRDAGYDAQRHRESVVFGLVDGVRIHVKDGESPGAVALRVVEIAEKILLRAGERGLIAQPAEKDDFKQYEGAEQLNIARPE